MRRLRGCALRGRPALALPKAVLTMGADADLRQAIKATAQAGWPAALG